MVIYACSPSDMNGEYPEKFNSICPFVEGEVLSQQWNAGYIVLSIVYAIMGAYVSILLVERLEMVSYAILPGNLSFGKGMEIITIFLFKMIFAIEKARFAYSVQFFELVMGMNGGK